MSCEFFREMVVDLARDERLPETDSASYLSHAASCPACAALLTDQQALSDGFRAWRAADFESRSSAPRLTEAELLAVFRSHAIEKEPLLFAPQRGNLSRRFIEVSGIAAMPLATAAVGVYSFYREQRARAPGKRRPQIEEVGKQVARGDIGKQQQVRPPALQSKPISLTASRMGSVLRRQPKQQPQAREAVESEIATDFINLAEGVAESPMESGQIVRVQVPRSTLASFGLPLNVDREDGAIKADLLVGHDGVARAIRFVR
ncbi:MAG: hypothetical protein WKF84_11920 [Pyrinomonadaceae bacterium]